MNQIPIYQHPFVDVFKITKLNEWSLTQKEGDVSEVYDKELAKNIIKVTGATSASNYFQVPASKNLPKQALGLIGKYVYVIMKYPPGKTFTIHFDYMVNETRLVKVSLSNIFKEFKNLNNSSLQIPITFQPEMWTMYVLNVSQLLEENNVFMQGQKSSFFMRSFQVTANCKIRGVFTSDIHYALQTLPKEMQMKCTKMNWFSQYAWQEYPPIQTEENQMVQDKENVTTNKKQVQEQQKKSIIKSQKKPESKTSKSVKFDDKNDTSKNLNKDLVHVEDQQRPLQEDQDFARDTQALNSNQNQLWSDTQIYQQQEPSQFEKTIDEIEQIKQFYQYNLEQKNILPQAEITLYQEETKPVNKIVRAIGGTSSQERFVLKPNPIMKIERVIGMHPRYQAQQIFYNKDDKLSKELIYCQANLMLGYYHPQQRQRLFYDHQTQNIEFLHVERGFAITAAKPLKEESNKDFEISIWDLDSSQQCVFTFKPPLISLHSISLSTDYQYLCLSGKDFQKRDLILVYMFQDLIKYKKVELYARQLSDFDIVNIRFCNVSSTALISCGKENIRFFKIKNNHLPSQSVILNNTARGKIFNKSVVDYTTNDKGQKKPSFAYVTTTDGLLYFVNYQTRQVDKIIQIHEDKITALCLSPERDFCVTASINGVLRIWSPDFAKLISEVKTQQSIVSCDINNSQKEIVCLSQQGSISVLDLEQSSFNILIRSHQEDITGMAYNKLTNRLVTISNDNSIKIWNAESMDVENEFTIQNDIPTKITSNPSDCMVAVGFKSGFLRIFDLQQNKLHMETMIFDSPLMDIQFSQDNKFLAVFFKNSNIVIFNIEKDYQPIKTIDYEYPNTNYFSISFSPSGKYLANISSNANTITIWETKNFSLKFHLDLTGEIISKIKFAPNDKDFIVLTTSSKVKFYRIGFSQLQFIKDAYGVTDLECVDFEISPNNKYLVFAGKEGLIKVYDYFMRGEAVASSQAFLGHLKYPTQVLFQDDMRYLYSIGQGNGIFKWSFMGDKEMTFDVTQYYEKIEEPNNVKGQTQKEELKETLFSQQDLQTYTQQQLEALQQELLNPQYVGDASLNLRSLQEEAQKIVSQAMQSVGGTGQTTNVFNKPPSLNHNAQSTLIQYNQNGYRFEQYEIQLKKVLACSTGSQVNNNLIWNKDLRYVAYSSQNIVIVEDLNQEKTQRLLKEGNDKIYQMKFSPNKRMLLAFTKYGSFDGFPCIFIWDAATLKKLNTLAVSDQELISVDFSPNSNMLLVVSKSGDKENGEFTTTVSIWDFLDGVKDILCKSNLPLSIIDAKWNPFINESTEFVTLSERKYHFWKVTNNLTLQYQEGDLPKKQLDLFSHKDDTFTTVEFVIPSAYQITNFLLIGLSNGYCLVTDSRVNQFLYNVKVINGPVRNIQTSKSRILIEGLSDTLLHCWPQGQVDGFSQGDPNSFFVAKEINLNLDGFPSAISYDDTVSSEFIVSTTSGTLWYGSWSDMATIKIKSCHSPFHEIKCFDYKYLPPGQFQVESGEDFYQFDQNYLIASSGKDGVIKLWNMFDMEFQLQFIVPKEECVTIAMHQFKPYMVASFTDGFIRFFEISKSKNLGRCQIHSDSEKNPTDYIIDLKILPSGNHILASSKNGQILLIFIQSWDPLSIKLEALASINTAIHTFDVSFLEPYNKWLVGTNNGKIIVYNRKDFNSFQQEIFNEENPPKFNFMDSFNVLDFVDNGFTESKRCNTLDHYYSVSKRNVVFNEVQAENECEGVFSNIDLALYIGFIKKCNYVFLRNFELHQCVKKIELAFLPISICLTPNTPFFVVLQADGVIKMVDMVNEENTSEIKTFHEEAKLIKICPNGRYILTGGDKGDICVWSIKKLQPNEILQQEYES